jgi:hypothetical protein
LANSTKLAHSFILSPSLILCRHLFGSQPISTSFGLNNRVTRNTTNSHHHHYARINNDVPGFHKLIRDGTHCELCHTDKANSDIEFYKNLRDRFRLSQSVVQDFYERYLQKTAITHTTIVGIHIRAGNGETGDFAVRGRNIDNINIWLDNLTELLVKASRRQNWRNTVLFIATDTPYLIDRIRSLLLQKNTGGESAITVVNRDQIRPSTGSGVLFGQQGTVESRGEDCLRGWEDTMIDMMLLSHVDVLIAARPSSFTQSLPMSLVLATESSSRRVAEPYCEVNTNATTMQCFGNFSDWCCRGRTSFSLQGIQRYEYVRMPSNLFAAELNSDNKTLQKKLKIQKRPERGCAPLPAGSKQICLPYDWSEFVVKPRELLTGGT